MSGGSFNYLCYSDPEDLFQKREDLAEMVRTLTAQGYTDAAKETESIKLLLDHFCVRVQARVDRLTEVWRMVEWTQSGDTAPEQIAEAIAKYRADIEPHS